MELRAVLEALDFLECPHLVELYTDNKYVKGVLQEGWNAQKNLDLIHSAEESKRPHDVDIEWVEGHSGNRYNEFVDTAAKEALKNRQSFAINRSPAVSGQSENHIDAQSSHQVVAVGKSATVRFLGDVLGTITPLTGKRSQLSLEPCHEKYPQLAALVEKNDSTTINFDEPAHIALSRVIHLAGEGYLDGSPEKTETSNEP